MSSYSSSNSSNGLSTLGVIQIVFLILKLTGLVNWSWWLVLAPSWINIILVIGILIWCGM